jgi:cellulose synthase/poly-beta-1,6-N-acetylglucosamine synthase-like glycosyltransferase
MEARPVVDSQAPLVSIVIPAMNNEDVIGQCMVALNGLNYPKGRYEVIVVDGRSRDRTADIARDYGATVVFDEGRGRSSAINIGVAHARGQYVAFTDADCVVEEDWLNKALRYFGDDLTAGVGGHTHTPSGARAATQAITFFLNCFNARFLLDMRSPKSAMYVDFIAGANSLYDMAKLRPLFPIPEIPRGGEDALLNLRIRDAGYRLIFAPEVSVSHYPYYTGTKAWFNQMVRFGKTRVQMMRIERRFHRLVNWIEGLSPPFVAVGASLLFVFAWQAFFGALALGMAVLLGLAALCWRKTGSLGAAVRIPLIAMVAAPGYSLGFIKELVFPEWKPPAPQDKRTMA